MSTALSSHRSSDTKNDRLYQNISENAFNKTPNRIEFIRLLLEDTELESMFDLDYVVPNNYFDNVTSIRQVFNKKTLDFSSTIRSLGKFLLYIKSGSTGHTFKGMSIPDPSRPELELNYAVKIVAYPKDANYGGINDPKRPENAELLILKVLSYFVVKRHTPHIVLPITTFNSDIETFINLGKAKMVKSKKYDKFIKKKEKGIFNNEVSVLISEWANGGDLLEYLNNNFADLSVKQWKVIFFQIISTIAIIQCKYPGFRHNDLKLNNILIQNLERHDENRAFIYCINDKQYHVPNIGMRCKIWDFDFACIPGMIENSKVNAEWTDDINVRSEAHQYYDIHYFFNTMVAPAFIENFFGRDKNGIPYVHEEVTEFVNRVIPPQIRTNEYVSERGRLLISHERLKRVRGIFYTTPLEILENDPFFSKMRP